jgi:hypothetical protein
MSKSLQIGQLQQLAAIVEKCLANPAEADFGTLAQAVQMLHGELSLMAGNLDKLIDGAASTTRDDGQDGSASPSSDQMSLKEISAIAQRAKRMGL